MNITIQQVTKTQTKHLTVLRIRIKIKHLIVMNRKTKMVNVVQLAIRNQTLTKIVSVFEMAMVISVHNGYK